MGRLNLLFLYTDEQRYDTLAAYGNSQIDMPNLNRLASQSVVFDRAYVTQPVCTPSRASLLTGLYPHTSTCTENNAPLPADVACLPEMLPAGACAAGHHGKWHLGDEIFAQHGFADWVAIDDGYRGYYGPTRDRRARSSYHHWLISQGLSPADGDAFTRGQVARLQEGLSKPAYLARQAVRFLRENRARPFCLFVNFFEPHMPFTGPRDGQYDPWAVPLPENFRDVPGEDAPLKLRLLYEGYRRAGFAGLDLSAEESWRCLRANYWGLCSQVDTHAGTILDALDALGLADRTIVVFTSDHGDMMGSHGLLAKCVMYEEAVRVPLLIRLPGRGRARRIEGPVSQIDLVPTLLDLMGAGVPDHLQGRSLRQAVEGGRHEAQDVVIEWNGPNNGFGDRLGRVSLPKGMPPIAGREAIEAAVRDPVRTIVTADGWKFTCSPLGQHELYHLQADPLERQNLAGRAEHAGRMRHLADRIRAWQRRTGDTVELPALPA